MNTSSIPTVAATFLAAVLATAFATPRDQKAHEPPKSRNVAVVIFPGVELLDFAGPGEVFAVARGKDGKGFHVYTVAESKAPLVSMGFVTITPQYSLDDCPKPDIVIVPGGDVPGDSIKLREWVRARSKETELMMSVCNGALVYANAGLLKGLDVTTHRSALQPLAMAEPEARVYTNRRFVDNGHVLTSAGIAAGIDGSLAVVARMCGEDAAWSTARHLEYDWRPDEIAKLHAQPGTLVDGSDGMHWAASVEKLGVAGAIAEYHKLADPPSDNQLNTWGYWLLRSSKNKEAIALLRMAASLFPESSNSMDSLSDALEITGDVEGAKEAARGSLARLEKEQNVSEERRQMVRNAASSRIARLSGAQSSALRFVCPPCGRKECDGLGYIEAGPCPNCHMKLIERSN